MRRLLDVSKKNPNFMKEDIFAETATILTSVSLLFSFIKKKLFSFVEIV